MRKTLIIIHKLKVTRNSNRFELQTIMETPYNLPFLQDCYDTFNSHQHLKSLNLFNIQIFKINVCTFKCIYVCIILLLHKKKTHYRLCQVFLTEDRTINLTLFSLLAVIINLTQFFFLMKVLMTPSWSLSFIISANKILKNLIKSHTLPITAFCV